MLSRGVYRRRVTTKRRLLHVIKCCLGNSKVFGGEGSNADARYSAYNPNSSFCVG